MNKIVGNETAFPLHHEPRTEYSDGLTIRQHFASLAMQGLLAKYTLNTAADQITVCRLSVELADSLIHELNHHNI